jgi:hypothetical protein
MAQIVGVSRQGCGTAFDALLWCSAALMSMHTRTVQYVGPRCVWTSSWKMSHGAFPEQVNHHGSFLCDIQNVQNENLIPKECYESHTL